MKKQNKIKEEIEEVIIALIKDVHYEHTYPAHTAYYQLDFDKMRNALKEFSRKLLQRFIEETRIEEAKGYHEFAEGYNQALKDINQKQAKWLKETYD